MSGAPGRDYQALVERYEKLLTGELRGGRVGIVDDLPVYRLELNGTTAAPQRWLLGAGLHGDEPAGHLALLEFLETRAAAMRGRVDLVVLPCINPWGYVHDCRENADGIDINRSFEDDSTPQARLWKQILEPEAFDLFLDFHEDWEFDGYYLFEIRHEEALPLGPGLIDVVRPHGPIYDHPSVDEVPVVDGVAEATPSVLASSDLGSKPMPLWLYHSGRAQRTITSETPSRAWDLSRRIAAHVSVANACLDTLVPA